MKVSIVTPTYNCEKYISNTIDSILNQTFSDFEVLIVDDCSTDGTVSLIKKYNDERIKLYVNEKNCGAAYCRNFALSKAQGEFIAFLDGDDMWLPKKLETMLKFIEQNNYDFAYSDYYESTDGLIKKHITGPKVMTHNKFLRNCYVGCLTVVYRKSIFPDLQIPNDIMKRNDYALWLKISERCNCYNCKEILAVYNKHTTSMSSGSKKSLIEYHYQLFTKLYGYKWFRAKFCAYRNVLFYIFKKLFFVKGVKQ